MEEFLSKFGFTSNKSTVFDLVRSKNNIGKTQEELDIEVTKRLEADLNFQANVEKKVVEDEEDEEQEVNENLPDPRPGLPTKAESDETGIKNENIHLPPQNKAKKIDEPQKLRDIKSKLDSNSFFSQCVFSDGVEGEKSEANYYNFSGATFEMSDGSFYQGYWFQKKRNGIGKQIFIREDKYIIFDGIFIDDVPSLHGVIRTYKFNPNSYYRDQYPTVMSYYKGDIVAGRKEGEGVFVSVEPDESFQYKYKGAWLKNKREGSNCEEEVVNYYDKSLRYRYIGDFSGDRKEGNGKITFGDDSFYEGTFRGGIMNGHGIYRFDEHRYYKGEFYEGKFDGEGELFLSADKIYKGKFKGDFMHGDGEFIWPSVDKKKVKFDFVGQFMYGIQNGRGEITVSVREKSKKIEGNWNFGQLVK